MFHPACLLLLWGAAVVVLQQLPLAGTLVSAITVLGMAWVANSALLNRLLFRSRWLFLTMALLFLWLTPGLRLPSPWGAMGMTQEGFTSAVEHVGRLSAMLALLVLLLSRLDHRGIVSGLYWLLSPLARVADMRRSVAVRLMLTLEEVAEKNGHEWKSLLRMPESDDDNGDAELQLALPPWTWRDNAVLASTFLAATAVLERV